MSKIFVLSRKDKKVDGGTQVTVKVQVDSEDHTINFWVSSGPVSQNNDFLVPFLLFPAMRLGLPLVLSDISPILNNHIMRIQQVFCEWWPNIFQPVVIQAKLRNAQYENAERGNALFFSCGVDSHYSLYKNYNKIDALVFIQGLDSATIELSDENKKGLDHSYALIKKAADAHSKPLIEVRTDVRKFADKFSDFGKHYHGSALCGVALLLSEQYQQFYLASSSSAVVPPPWGSHPLLDPFWSSERLLIIHDGLEFGRLEKLNAMKDRKQVLENLYVCSKLKLSNSDFNCSHCVGCLKTMIALNALDILDKTPTFEKKIDWKKVSRMPVLTSGARKSLVEAVSLTKGVERKAIEDALRGRYYTWYWKLGRGIKAQLSKVFQVIF